MTKRHLFLLLLGILLPPATITQAEVVIATVPVGNTGTFDDTHDQAEWIVIMLAWLMLIVLPAIAMTLAIEAANAGQAPISSARSASMLARNDAISAARGPWKVLFSQIAVFFDSLGVISCARRQRFGISIWRTVCLLELRD